jgi:hypothetical protein
MSLRRELIVSVTVAGALVLAAARPAAGQTGFEIEGSYWMSDLTADARVSDGTLGTDVDFKKDLGLKDKNFPDGRLIWHIGPHNSVRLAYLQVSYDGDSTVNRTISFHGQTYTVGTEVLTRLDKKYYRLGWTWQFVDLPGGVLKFGTLLEIKGFSIDAKLRAPYADPPVDEKKTFDLVLPTAGLVLDIHPIPTLSLFAEASGMSAGSRGSMFDAEGGIKIFPLPHLALFATYRVLDLKYKDKPDFANLKLSGPFAGVSVRF